MNSIFLQFMIYSLPTLQTCTNTNTLVQIHQRFQFSLLKSLPLPKSLQVRVKYRAVFKAPRFVLFATLAIDKIVYIERSMERVRVNLAPTVLTLSTISRFLLMAAGDWCLAYEFNTIIEPHPKLSFFPIVQKLYGFLYNMELTNTTSGSQERAYIAPKRNRPKDIRQFT